MKRVKCIYKLYLLKRLKPLEFYKCLSCKSKIVYELGKISYTITDCPYFYKILKKEIVNIKIPQKEYGSKCDGNSYHEKS